MIVPCIYNSELLKKNATEKDPWALEYTKSNTAGSGAYKVTNWKPGVEAVYERHDDWVGGKLPKLKRVIWRTVPSAGNRRALMERGDADISFDLPNKDFSEMKKEGKLDDHLHPDRQRHVHRHEREEAAVRQCESASGGRLRDALSEDHGCGDVRPRQAAVRRSSRTTSPTIAWPQPTTYTTDMAKAKALMAEAGSPARSRPRSPSISAPASTSRSAC